VKVMSDKVTDEFIDGLKTLDFNASKIPNSLEEVQKELGVIV
jgi:phenylalanine-4-hydroxylase